MAKLAIIGGTGLSQFPGIVINKKEMVRTPFGKPSGAIIHATHEEKELIFIARHGFEHSIAPHKINYRANIYALKECGVQDIIAINAVGGICDTCPPNQLVVPDQIIDYSHSRRNTFYEDSLSDVVHIDFSFPYTEALRLQIKAALKTLNINVADKATYGATQGPRLETAAEIVRLKRDGCHIVGMTAMPEAVLARELGLNYASCCVVVNWAAGLTNKEITMQEIEDNLVIGMKKVKKMLNSFIQQY